MSRDRHLGRIAPLELDESSPQRRAKVNRSQESAKLTPVVVHWVDSVAQPGWGGYAEDTNMVCATAGFLVRKTPKAVVVALNKSNHVFGDYITIPCCSVISIKTLRPGPAHR